MLVTWARQSTAAAPLAGERVERGCFHFDGENSLGARRRDRLSRLAERCVGRPARTDMGGDAGLLQCALRRDDQAGIGLGENVGGGIMIARPLIAQCPIDNHEIGRRPRRHDLTGRGHADQQSAPRCEEFFGDQHREWRANGSADNSGASAGHLKTVKLGVIAGPCLNGPRRHRNSLRCRTMSPSGSSTQKGGTSAASNPFCRRASRSRADGSKTDGASGCLLSSIGSDGTFSFPWLLKRKQSLSLDRGENEPGAQRGRPG